MPRTLNEFRDKDDDKEIFVVTVTSSGFEGGNLARITINNEEIYTQTNENGTRRGLHIVVIDPFTGRIAQAQTFDTYKSSETLENFIKSQNFESDFIIIAGCQDDCTKGLSDKVRSWFREMGS